MGKTKEMKMGINLKTYNVEFDDRQMFRTLNFGIAEMKAL